MHVPPLPQLTQATLYLQHSKVKARSRELTRSCQRQDRCPHLPWPTRVRSGAPLRWTATVGKNARTLRWGGPPLRTRFRLWFLRRRAQPFAARDAPVAHLLSAARSQYPRRRRDLSAGVAVPRRGSDGVGRERSRPPGLHVTPDSRAAWLHLSSAGPSRANYRLATRLVNVHRRHDETLGRGAELGGARG